MNGLKALKLSFSYEDGKIIFRDLSLNVKSGEILAILGPNGSGKTTLLKCLNGLLKPNGSVLIESFGLSDLNEEERAKLIGYVPQAHHPAFPYRVIDVVVSGRIPHLGFSTPTREDYELAYDVLERLNLTHLADKPYTRLSGGELRLVLIARALVQQPRILLLDEPASNLDLRNRVRVLKILRDVSREGIAVVMSEHDPNLASAFSDKALLMHNGELVAYGEPQDVLTKENIARVYGVNVEIIKRNGKVYLMPDFE